MNERDFARHDEMYTNKYALLWFRACSRALQFLGLGLLMRPTNSSLQVPAPNRVTERKSPVGSCRCRVHAAAGRPKTFRSERGDPQRTRNPTDHTQRPRVPRLAAPGKHCATIIEHRRCSFPRRFFPRVEHRPSRTPRSTRRTQRSIHHSVKFGAHTPLPRTGRRWEQRRRGRGRAGQGPAVAGPCMSHLKRKRGVGAGGLFLRLLLRSSEAAVGQSAR